MCARFREAPRDSGVTGHLGIGINSYVMYCITLQAIAKAALLFYTEYYKVPGTVISKMPDGTKATVPLI